MHKLGKVQSFDEGLETRWRSEITALQWGVNAEVVLQPFTSSCWWQCLNYLVELELQFEDVLQIISCLRALIWSHRSWCIRKSAFHCYRYANGSTLGQHASWRNWQHDALHLEKTVDLSQSTALCRSSIEDKPDVFVSIPGNLFSDERCQFPNANGCWQPSPVTVPAC
ncbi:hypothetical protein KL949_002036 [Ogataea haglerorum]|uniref:Uncharacterized protein n=1 Tax=Ogataea haglerorum TaxID=1937702 RepID=A0ABQ7RH48_9ASCO|nr:hypothetical protein KL913_002103 [Ogataea haglerorum]KAG7720071.1 hypothetical protein KL949_002036 [Ogataea haglerorum]KAG7765478.1 hypothetical protein KL946_002535 [Ogataea haglerorum]KAG7768526.1 hypothetical protein KL931_003132 [Ogataea haglerorum]